MKNVINIILLSFFYFLFFSCASNRAYSIKDAAFAASREIPGRINTESTIAVISISSRSSNVSMQTTTWLENYLLEHGKFRIVSRQRTDTLLKELHFGLSEHVSEENAQSIGKILGANYSLIGEIKYIANKSYLNIQVLETETAVLVYSNSFRIKDKEINARETESKPLRF